MKGCLSLLLLLLPLTLWGYAPTLTAEQKAYLTSKKEILACIDPDWMPYEKLENGRHIGMSKDYLALFSAYINLPIRLVPTNSWDQTLDYAKKRKCDIVSLAMETPDRSQYLNFAQPYLSIPLAMATRIDEIFILNIAEVTDRPLGIVRGYAYTELLRKKYPKINLVEVDSVTDGLNLVANGKLFGFVDSLAAIGYTIQKNYIGELKIAGKFDETWELGVGVRNDDPVLLAIFEQATKAVSAEQKQEIMNRWISVKYEQGLDYGLLLKWLAVVIFIGFVLAFRHFELIRYNRRLQLLSITDSLTGLNNRVKIDEAIQEQLDRFERYRTPFSLLMLDIDHFKRINDRCGHQEGDKVLVLIARLLKEGIRKTDVVGRWGGEEFMVVLPETELAGALELAEKLRTDIENQKQLPDHHVTASFGVALVVQSDHFTNLVKRADDALLQAKNEGRNRVVSLS